MKEHQGGIEKMYCRKCGKEIAENSAFCPYCGYDLSKTQSNVNTNGQEKMLAAAGKKTADIYKWIIPIAIAAGVVVIVIAVFLGIKMMRKPEETSRQEVTKEEQKSIDETGEIEEPEYPEEIMLDEEVRQGVTSFLDLLSKIDTGDTGEVFSRSTAIDDLFVSSFLVRSLWYEIPFVNGQTAGVKEDGWVISEEILDIYLEDSINCQEYDLGNLTSVTDGVVTVMSVTPTSVYGNETPQIDKVMQISDEEIEVFGNVKYVEEITTFEPYTAEFDVILTENPDSMWGGYSLKEIKSWGRQEDQGSQEVQEISEVSSAAGDWKQAFIDYINPRELFAGTANGNYGASIEENFDTAVAFRLWDMNKDGIPEVICSYWRDSAGTGVLLAYDSQTNTIIENEMDGRFFTCSGDKICASNSFGGVGYSNVYALRNDGRLMQEFSYSWSMQAAGDGSTMTYFRNEIIISEAEYQQYENTYTQPLEMDLTYGRLIQDIQNYAQ